MEQLSRPGLWVPILSFLLLSAAPLWAKPVAWETYVDEPSLQISHRDDAIRGMKSGKSCTVAEQVYRDLGGDPDTNFCAMAIEVAGGIGYFAHCDRSVSYLVQIDLNECRYDELEMFRDRRLTGSFILDEARRLILFSHLEGTYAFALGDREPAAFFPHVALYSKREFFSDAQHVYLLDTASAETPRIHRINLDRLGHVRVSLGAALIEDFQRGRVLLRSLRDGRLYGVYDVRERSLLYQWQVEDQVRPYFMGERWVAFWKGPTADDPGEWTLVDLHSGESVFHAPWSERRPPSLQWKDDILFAGSKALLTRNNILPVSAPVRQIGTEE